MERKPIHSQQILKARRQELRNNATKQEKLLWGRLRGKQLGCKFQRQHSIGPYIADLYCASKRLIIELDGKQHVEAQEYDRKRSGYFKSLGIKVLRFWNNEVDMNIEDVVDKIKTAVPRR